MELEQLFLCGQPRQGYEPLIFEQQLAHNVGSEVFRAYMRSDLLDRRRAMMDEWENTCLV